MPYGHPNQHFSCVWIFATWTTKFHVTHKNDFCEKKVPKLPSFKELLFLKSPYVVDNGF
jgi:hypothetical protein